MCQAAHAAHESGLRLSEKEDDPPSVVICHVADERTLLAFAAKLSGAGVRTVVFREPDIGNVATALATEPVGQEQRRLFKKLSLWKAVGALPAAVLV